MAVLVWNAVSRSRTLSEAADELFSPDYNGWETLTRLQRAIERQSWMMTASAGVNVREDLLWTCCYRAYYFS